MSVGEAVKNRIIELCSLRGISINKLCSMSGVTQSTVNNIISGRNQSTSVATIKKLCDGLDITLETSSPRRSSTRWNRRYGSF